MAYDPSEFESKLKEIQDLIEAVKNDPNLSLDDQTENIKKQNELLREAQELYVANRKEIHDGHRNLEKQYKSLEKSNKSLQGLALTNKGIMKTFGEMSQESAKFAKSTDEWFKKGEKLAEQYLKVSKNIGVSEARSKTVASNFNSAVKESMLLGTELNELEQMMTNFAEQTGRARIVSDEELVNMSKIKEGTGLYDTEVASMAEQFDLMGISSQKMVNVLNSAIGGSREMGLNSNKVIKTLQSNMKTMQQYSFAGGVKGMTEMAKQAVKMRIDVGDVLQMADKFYEPEAAIEAAANLQMLGGDIAEAFGDPFETMYLARNKPEELAKKVGEMTENMVTFNEETGEFDMPPEARMQLKAVSEQLGIGMDSLTEMTRQASKIKNIKMNVSGNILDENMREGIAGMARMKDGKWQVDFMEGGQKFTKSIDDLTNEQAKLVMDQSDEKKGKTEKDFLADIAMYTQTFSEKVDNIGQSQQFGLAGEIDAYGVTMDAFLRESLDTYAVKSNNMFQALSDKFSAGGLNEALRDAFVDDTGESIFEEQFSTVFTNMTNAINKSAENGKLNISKLNANAADANIFTDGLVKYKDVKLNTKNGDTIVSGPKGTFSLDQDDSYYGKDGSFVAGTNLGIGGGGSGGSGNVGVFGEIKVTGPAGAIASINASELKKMIINQINQTERTGGVVSGKQMVDNGSLNG